jgi:hypothetical protein
LQMAKLLVEPIGIVLATRARACAAATQSSAGQVLSVMRASLRWVILAPGQRVTAAAKVARGRDAARSGQRGARKRFARGGPSPPRRDGAHHRWPDGGDWLKFPGRTANETARRRRDRLGKTLA